MEVMNFLNEVTSRHPQAISFGPGRPYEGLFEVERIGYYLDAYQRHLSEELGRTPDEVRTLLFQYGRTNGQIHELVARALRNDEGIEADPQSLVVTVGCQEGMFIALRALFRDPSDVLLVSSPCYVGITGAARLLDIETVHVPEGENGVDPDVLQRTVAELRAAGKRPRALYLVPDFSNPTGTCLPLPARHRLLELAEAEDLLLLEDNPYGFFTRTGSGLPTLKSLDTRRRVIYLGSFAKTCFPGARVGYVVADQHVQASDGSRTLLADELSKIKGMVTVNTPAISQAVIGGMLISHDFRLREANKPAADFYQENLAVLLDSLDRLLPPEKREAAGIHWNAPEGGFFLTLTLPVPADNALLEESAREHGVIWTPMRYFYPEDSGGQNQMRLSLSYLTPDQVAEGARRLVGLLERSCV
ncbi:PLP-dependent aminotransferase family protein [Streptomyces piniterrae]|uniref:PLP-dependent aminotransferase family protein n=1 Tax=Streptomyces piniterrae TaxID=2571125 RepID=A0A4U0NK45_9ACTN|nr:PLP-dependent aminotransferase family protein [Streptomyces piniterrae]TJZ54705.1 PLP-dependent aminotransferase family protein [Streptomyces piniterrae]